MNSKKRQKDRTLKDELPRFVGTQYTTGDQWRLYFFGSKITADGEDLPSESEQKLDGELLYLSLWC